MPLVDYGEPLDELASFVITGFSRAVSRAAPQSHVKTSQITENQLISFAVLGVSGPP